MFDRWGSDQGLPADSVRGLARTPDGYLWVGTSAGVARFDGVRFAPFNRANTPAFRGQEVWALLADRAGGLWVGTDDGLVRRDPDGTFRGFAASDGLPAKHVTCLAEGPDGAVWVGTLGGGLARYHDGALSACGGPAAGLTNRNVWAVLPAADGTVWVGTVDGLFALRDGTFTRYGTECGLPSTFVLSLAPAAAGGLWVGTMGGLARFDGTRAGRVYRAADGLPGERVKCLAADGAGGVWAGFLSGGGAARVRAGPDGTGGAVEPLAEADGLPPGGVFALLEDGENGLWVGATAGGLTRLKDGRLLRYTVRHGLPGVVVHTVAEAPDGTVWAVTEGGLARRDGNRFIPVHHNTLPAKPETVAVTRKGVVWVGGGNTLVRWANDRGEVFELARPADRRDRPNTVSQIFEDAAGTLWVGSGSGLQRFERGRLVALTAADGLADTHVRCLCESPRGTLWVGTRNGLNRVAGGRVYRPDLGGAEADEVTALHAAPGGAVWVGTKNGVLWVEGDRAIRISRREGLVEDEVRSLVLDPAGGVWVGGPKGLTRIEPASVTRLLAGESAAVSARRYGVEDGLPHPACAGAFFHPASLVATDGSVWVATDRGLGRATPERMARSFAPPPAVVEELTVDGVAANLVGAVRLPPGTRRLDVRYTALGLRSPGQVRFEYRLVGFDPDWVAAGAGRTVSYTNLPPGEYEFVVRAADEPGEWGVEGRAGVRQEPAFHQTWWFLAACGLAAGLLLAGAGAWRSARVRERERLVRAERERVARELHDTLMQEVGAAAWTLDAVADDLLDDVSRAAVADAALRVRAGLTDCRHAVWELRATGLNDLGGALQAAARELLGGGDIRLDFDTTGAPWGLPPAGALALFRIGREAVANALRHAHPTTVRVSLAYTRLATVLTVTDDGCGFDPAAVGAGSLGAAIGLVGLRERAAGAGVRLVIESRVGCGTQVRAAYHRPHWLVRLFARRVAPAVPPRVPKDATP